MTRLLDVEIDDVDGVGIVKAVPEVHGWSIETTVENSRWYAGDGVESVSAEGSCFVRDPDDLRALADYLSEKADEMEAVQDG